MAENFPHIAVNGIFIEENAEKLGRGQNIANEFFEYYDWMLDKKIADELKKEEWKKRIPEAEKTLKEWEEKSGRKQNYKPEELATEWCKKETANAYRQEKLSELVVLNTLHDATVRYAVMKLAPKLIEKGKQGMKLAVVELSARLGPSLTFPGSSEYFNCLVIPYSQESRKILGEKGIDKRPLVSKESALESATNMMEKFGVTRVLAETSMAPSKDVLKSRKKPQMYLCKLYKEPSGSLYNDVIFHDSTTHFREKFDSEVRQMMYLCLRGLTGA